jgi:hypothetical protein
MKKLQEFARRNPLPPLVRQFAKFILKYGDKADIKDVEEMLAEREAEKLDVDPWDFLPHAKFIKQRINREWLRLQKSCKSEHHHRHRRRDVQSACPARLGNNLKGEPLP